MIALYLGAVIAANLAVARFGPGVAVIVAFGFIGLDLSARDVLHDRWRGEHLKLRMGALIATGSALSALLNWQAAPVALASCVAFAVAGALDSLVYGALANRAPLVRVNCSNLAGALADSLIFPALAFGLPMLWPVAGGQLAAKLLGGALWSVALWGRR